MSATASAAVMAPAIRRIIASVPVKVVMQRDYWIFGPLTDTAAPELSVKEVPLAGKVHRHTGGLSRGDDLVVPHRTTRLNDRAHASIQQNL